MYNPKNNGTAIGIITSISATESDKAVRFFEPNADKSVRLAFNLLAGDNFRSKYTQAELDKMDAETKARKVDANGKGYRSQRIGFTGYLPYDTVAKAPRNMSIYTNLKPGDLVEVTYSVKSGSFEKDGVMQYTQSLEVEDITILHRAQPKTPAAAPAAESNVAGEEQEAF